MGHLKSPIHHRIDTIFVHVTDLEASIKWYGKLMGVEVKEGDRKGPIYTFAMGPGRPGLTLDNHSMDDGYELLPSNQPLFNLSTEDIHAAYEHVVGMGAEIVEEIETFPDLSYFTFKDPDGNVLMICDCFS
ncbi:VOC family protein [Paenibacillus silviterrae]|uniref:VOC family protein n=1 Tax=Paenibacillus silviterrae TaxID=3242194 RepID=UPI002542DF31|nr:VOC family protein [Paenibacillus chinjuensis]